MTKRKIFAGIAKLLLTATASFAATSAANTNTVSPTLVVSATIQDAVMLNLKTGTLGGMTGHCTIAAGGGGDYNMNFGTVDALAVNPGWARVYPDKPGPGDFACCVLHRLSTGPGVGWLDGDGLCLDHRLRAGARDRSSDPDS